MDRAQREARRAFLGASEVAAVCGLDPFKSALDVWAAKMGLDQYDESDAARIGNLLEPVLLADYAQRTASVLRQPGTLRRSDITWAACTPDSIALKDGAERNVQVKVVGRHMASEWDHKTPHYVQAQVQWEMWVAELECTDVVALVGGTDLRTIDVERNESQIALLVDICSTFWEEHVLTKRMPQLDGSETARRILELMHPQSRGCVEADDDLRSMVQRHQHLDRQIEHLDDCREALRNEIRRSVGEHEGATFPGGRVMWKTNKAGVRTLRIYTRDTNE